MSRLENAVNWALNIAYDNSHGYSQDNRWGPDYDCSSLVIQAFENAGIPVKSNGATYTGNIKSVFESCGFKNVINDVNVSNGNGLKYGDVLLNQVQHTAIYIGNNQIVHASINEKGTAHGGQSGDQTGREICVRNYYNYPWDVVLRYSEEVMPAPDNQDIDWEGLRRFIIAIGQHYANIFVCHNCIEEDGIVGPATKRIKIRVLQHAMNLDYNAGLTEDGIWGPATEAALSNHYIKYGEKQNMVTAIEIFCAIAGNNPNGIEIPGQYGDGLKNALKTDYVNRDLIKFCTLI